MDLKNVFEANGIYDVFRKKKRDLRNVIKLRNDGFEGNTKNVLLFFLWKI